MSKKYEPPFRRNTGSAISTGSDAPSTTNDRFANLGDARSSFASRNVQRSFDRPVINTSMTTAAPIEPGTATPHSRKPYSDRFRQDTSRPSLQRSMTEDEFPVLIGKAQLKPTSVLKETVDKENPSDKPSSDKPKKPTFAELASEWTKKVQEQKAKEDAERAIAEEAAAKVKAAEDKVERERMRILTSSLTRLHMTPKRKHGDLSPWDDKEVDIGCANSDHSEDEPYNSNDDQTYEEEEEEEEEEEDADAFWNYRRNKNEMY